MEAASPWRAEDGRWIRASGPYVVAQATDRGYYVIRVKGRQGGMTGSASSVESARARVDRILLEDGWALEF